MFLQRFIFSFKWMTCLCCLLSFASHVQSSSLESATESVSPIETDAEFYDIFAGTVQYKNQELQLRRCSLGNDLYLLDFQNPEEANQLKTLLQQNTKFWVNLIAQPSEHNGQYMLNVREIAELHTQQSCHLNDVLNDLLNHL
ncbi:hypothetical protein KAM398_08040 [Acinetobacter sp. KAM398]|uniref:hypothetical protein n=1 Tax=unclassified Acinetobacter TaxID=196816 RepID=UPI001F2BB51C|nr:MULTISPECIES: hypothetical protein [unclassified Acinetobacter]GJC30675.1 hypothetical protein KAM392_06540 [Acinetobacter sp. KAM392]GJC33484.1 hypothetical protein KAM393_06530 [Acinetobacter sp. KAM393]GJC36309.1 hypothetical protein KAM394_06490 [Acinetobacter sp. KAM394]GJC39132.1 hypothetical protein KAM395_06530 [Acinetobacter sp. KAM395]GJC42202.1 hypothetical protein KAM396_08990 [Acinetobacter sp. KAM396]